jgi:hypothetical protein
MEIRVAVFRGALGGWEWEQVNEQGEVVAESPYQFDSQAECMQDARAHAAPGTDPYAADSVVPGL